MANWKKTGLLTGFTLLTIGGAFYLTREAMNATATVRSLKGIAKKLVTVVSTKIHNISTSALTVRIDIKLKNISTNGFKMTYPFIKVSQKEKVVGSSQAVDQVISIPPMGECNISGIYVDFPLKDLLSVALSTLSADTTQDISLSILTSSLIDPMWKVDPVTKAWSPRKDYGLRQLHQISYEDTKNVTLKKGA